MDKRSALVVSLLSLLLLFSFRGYAEPIWSGNFSSTQIGYSQTPSRFNITWSNIEAGSLVYLEENCTNPAGTNYSLSNYTDSVYNLSIVLPACSDAYWKSYASNSQGWNTSDTWYFTINKATANIALSIIPNTSVTYGMPTNATCTNSNPELSTTKLYRNGTDVTALENNILFTLPGGTWNYYCNATDTNYTSSPKSYSFIVSKVPTSLNLSLNGTQGNRTYTSNDTANFTVILNVSGNINLTSNYTGWINQSSAFSPFYYYPSFYSVGNWSYLTASFDGNENYTPSSPITYYFNVTDATPPAYLSSTIDAILAGYSTVFRTLWTDNAGLSGYIFSTNNSGTWINDSWISFSGGNWSNITNKIINSTAGYLIQWEIYANDTSNNWNVSVGAPFYTKLSDGLSCTADIQCFYNCVSGVCRQLNVCGDGHCDSAETCSFCPIDCGACQSTTTSSSGSSAPPGSFLIKDLASSLAILQGESKPSQFTLSNTLANNIANVSVTVSGIDSSWYTLSKSFVSILAHGSSQAMTITFNIPNSAEAKNYDVTISAKGKVLGETTSRTTTKTMTLIVNSSQPQPIEPLPSVTETPQETTSQDNNTANITSNQTNSGATGLAPAFEFFKSNLVLILAIAACLLIFIFRDNLTTALGGTLGDEKAEKTHKAKSASPLKGLKDKLNYKVVVNLKKESKAKSLKGTTGIQGAEKIPEIISEKVPEKGPKRPAMLEKEIKRDIKELQSILDAEKKVGKNKKKFDMNNN